MSAKPSAVAAGNLGFPRIGAGRELKTVLERYWRGAATADDLERVALDLRERHWQMQAAAGLRFIPSNDFSLYDHVLDAAALIGAIPARFSAATGCADLDTYFAMARGNIHTPAMEMTKWFDTNYHFIVPELDSARPLWLASDKPVREYREARAIGIQSRPVLLGPVSLLTLARARGSRVALVDAITDIYRETIVRLAHAGADWVQIDEPCLGLDLPDDAWRLIRRAYSGLAGRVKLLLATYFANLRENLPLALSLPVDAIHLDLVRAPGQLARALELVPSHMSLSLGVVNGRAVWRTDLDRAITVVRTAVERIGAGRVQAAPSCSLLHVPMDCDTEIKLDPRLRGRLAFATQKLDEVALIARGATDDSAEVRELLAARRREQAGRPGDPRLHNSAVRQRAASVTPEMRVRQSAFPNRRLAQAAVTPLPLLPTTTIGSLPQTSRVRQMRAAARRGQITSGDYQTLLRQEIAAGIRMQEELDIDVLVHGEFERGDMVEFFAERLDGFAFTDHGWVQSYGSRCVKPPLLHGDVSRAHGMTVEWARYAQSLTERPVKAMLTGPVTMLQWSFVRDDLAPESVATQIALALRDEIRDLEAAGLRVIQVDEPALREGLPLRRDAQDDHLRWAVDAFRLATGGARDATQIHTHMCYADFGEIIHAIARMDADVISLEAARSAGDGRRAVGRGEYQNDIGPGVYDIHSPRIPDVEEIARNILRALETLAPEQLWVNPDCGLKTRSWVEVRAALLNMVAAAHRIRAMMARVGQAPTQGAMQESAA